MKVHLWWLEGSNYNEVKDVMMVMLMAHRWRARGEKRLKGMTRLGDVLLRVQSFFKVKKLSTMVKENLQRFGIFCVSCCLIFLFLSSILIVVKYVWDLLKIMLELRGKVSEGFFVWNIRNLYERLRDDGDEWWGLLQVMIYVLMCEDWEHFPKLLGIGFVHSIGMYGNVDGCCNCEDG